MAKNTGRFLVLRFNGTALDPFIMKTEAGAASLCAQYEKAGHHACYFPVTYYDTVGAIVAPVAETPPPPKVEGEALPDLDAPATP